MDPFHPFRRSRDIPPRDDETEALLRSINSGALARVLGPVLLLGRDGSVLATNRDGYELSRSVHWADWFERNGVAAVLSEGGGRLVGLRWPVTRDPQDDRIFDFQVQAAGANAVLLLGRDATESYRRQSTLYEQVQRFHDVIGAAGAFVWETDATGRFRFVMPGSLGWAAEAMVGHKPAEFLIDPEGTAAGLFVTRAPVTAQQIWMARGDRHPVAMMSSAMPIFDGEGAWSGARGICRDISEVIERDAALERALSRERQLASVVRHLRDELEPSNMLAAAAAAIVPALGVSGAVIYSMDNGVLVQSARHGTIVSTAAANGLVDRLAEDPEMIAAEIAGRRALGVGTHFRRTVNGAVCLWRQPTDPPWTVEERELLNEVAAQLGIAIEQITKTEELKRVSATDVLTGLINRRTFFAELPRHLQRADGHNGSAALVYVDLDNFKQVNDIHGHQRGDVALRRVSDILVKHSRQGDLVARLGGDEFALCLDNMTGENALRWGEGLLSAAGSLSDLSGSAEKPLGFSIGVAIYQGGSGEPVQDLINRADATMYEVKRAGKGQVRLAEPPGPPRADRRA